jgi:hypothetical protein
VIAATILDRRFPFSHVFLITSPSYRLKGKRLQPLDPLADLSGNTGSL